MNPAEIYERMAQLIQEGTDPQSAARETGAQFSRCLIDMDIRSPEKQVIGGDPAGDLDAIDTEPVSTLILPGLVVTVYAHTGDGEDAADLLHHRQDFKGLIVHYARHYLEQGIGDFALNAISDAQAERIAEAVRQQYDNTPAPRAEPMPEVAGQHRVIPQAGVIEQPGADS